MNVDVIILSNAKTDELRKLTQQTIDSCLNSEHQITFNILVLEQNAPILYEHAITYHTREPFNYNGFMNVGIAMSSNEYVCLCNNDLIFTDSWATNLISGMKQTNILSACPSPLKGRGIEYGYRNSHEMYGWCIMTNRKLFDIIGKIDDEFPFWFADNIYSEQLKRHGVKHAIVKNSVVKHLGSKTLHSLSKEQHDNYTTNEIRRFIERHPTNESSEYFKRHL